MTGKPPRAGKEEPWAGETDREKTSRVKFRKPCPHKNREKKRTGGGGSRKPGENRPDGMRQTKEIPHPVEEQQAIRSISKGGNVPGWGRKERGGPGGPQGGGNKKPTLIGGGGTEGKTKRKDERPSRKGLNGTDKNDQKLKKQHTMKKRGKIDEKKKSAQKKGQGKKYDKEFQRDARETKKGGSTGTSQANEKLSDEVERVLIGPTKMVKIRHWSN